MTKGRRRKTGGKESKNMIKVGIIGATGYAGQELVRLLQQHPKAEIVWYGSKSYVGQIYSEVLRIKFEMVYTAFLDSIL